jgi:hypothetical protein
MLQCQVAVWDPQPAACRLQGGELIYTLETLQQPWCCGVCGSAGSKLVSCSFKPKASVAGVHDSLGRVLCCAVLCCAVLCCAVLCCAVLCCAVLCCAVLCCAVLCCQVVLPSGVRYTDLRIGGGQRPIKGYLVVVDYE